MDKEAQKKIEQILVDWHSDYADARPILKVIEKLGYRKLPKDKPPLLAGCNHIHCNLLCHKDQREADIKFYGGEQNGRKDEGAEEEAGQDAEAGERIIEPEAEEGGGANAGSCPTARR